MLRRVCTSPNATSIIRDLTATQRVWKFRLHSSNPRRHVRFRRLQHCCNRPTHHLCSWIIFRSHDQRSPQRNHGKNGILSHCCTRQCAVYYRLRVRSKHNSIVHPSILCRLVWGCATFSVCWYFSRLVSPKGESKGRYAVVVRLLFRSVFR